MDSVDENWFPFSEISNNESDLTVYDLVFISFSQGLQYLISDVHNDDYILYYITSINPTLVDAN